MNVEHFLTLCRYNEWANRRYDEILAALSPVRGAAENPARVFSEAP